MPINGLLISLTADKTSNNKVIELLEKNDHVELGEQNHIWLPVSVETKSVRESHEVHEWIEKLEGVQSVDVVFASVEESNNA